MTDEEFFAALDALLQYMQDHHPDAPGSHAGLLKVLDPVADGLKENPTRNQEYLERMIVQLRPELRQMITVSRRLLEDPQ